MSSVFERVPKTYSGLAVWADTGAPAGCTSYKTLVLLHGFGSHAEIFSRLLPFAGKFKCRIITVNRRDYPGSGPYSDEERLMLTTALESTPEAAETMREYMKARGREVYDLLRGLIVDENLPLDGGIIIAGWSYGSSWMLALLASISSFPANDVEVAKYIHRVVTYDPPYHALGYPPPAGGYNPLFDPSVTREEGVKLFGSWVSGYFKHGESPSELEYRTQLDNPRPTLATMSSEDAAATKHPAPTLPGGSDHNTLTANIKHGVSAYIKDLALYPPADAEDPWRDVEWRYIWCDQSVWEMPWGMHALRAELDEAAGAGKAVRKVSVVRWRRANHFIHWDEPERALEGFLTDTTDDL
ncbi:alpha/beta-hydrolase [Amylostereum chailletii]|nr:alpha/beta-hydrolase [Amylostereum chailletii]